MSSGVPPLNPIRTKSGSRAHLKSQRLNGPWHAWSQVNFTPGYLLAHRTAPLFSCYLLQDMMVPVNHLRNPTSHSYAVKLKRLEFSFAESLKANTVDTRLHRALLICFFSFRVSRLGFAVRDKGHSQAEELTARQVRIEGLPVATLPLPF